MNYCFCLIEIFLWSLFTINYKDSEFFRAGTYFYCSKVIFRGSQRFLNKNISRFKIGDVKVTLVSNGVTSGLEIKIR